MNKEAFMEGMKDRLKQFSPTAEVKAMFSDPTFTHEKAIPVLDAIFSHHTGTGLAGAGLGALAGGLVAPRLPKKKEKLLDSLKRRLGSATVGAGIGGLAGLGGSFVAPKASEQVNDFLVSNLIRKPLGYAISNNVDPRGYGNDGGAGSSKFDKDFFQSQGFMTEDKKPDYPKFIKAVARNAWKDEPAPWAVSPRSSDTEDLTAIKDEPRNLLVRKSFDLPERPMDIQGYDYFMPKGSRTLLGREHLGRQPILPIPSKSQEWEINTRTPEGKAWFKSVFGKQDREDVLTGRKPYLVDSDNSEGNTMGSYVLKHKMLNSGPHANAPVPALSLNDPWDFNLHKNESLDSPTNWARYFINKIIRPQTVSMDVTGDKAFPNIYADPYLNRVAPKEQLASNIPIVGPS